jgi:hypothetical protein
MSTVALHAGNSHKSGSAEYLIRWWSDSEGCGCAAAQVSTRSATSSPHARRPEQSPERRVGRWSVLWQSGPGGRLGEDGRGRCVASIRARFARICRAARPASGRGESVLSHWTPVAVNSLPARLEPCNSRLGLRESSRREQAASGASPRAPGTYQGVRRSQNAEG